MLGPKNPGKPEKLKRYDSFKETGFNAMVDLAAQLCQTSIGIMHLRDNNDVWFTAPKGIQLKEIRESISFGKHVPVSQNVTEIQDALTDKHFRNHPLVKGAPYIRFYAASPLMAAKGNLLGKLSVLDVKPNKLTEDQVRGLQTIAAQIVHQIELKDQIRELRQISKEAAKSRRTKDRFLSNLAHEIRTPVNGIVGMTKLLLEEPLQGSQKELIASIDYSGNLLLNIVNDTLDLSRIKAEGLSFRQVQFNLLKTLKNFQKSIGFKAQEKEIDLTLSLDNQLPARVVGDPTRLNQILMNIVGNAVKFTAKGKVSIQVKVKENTVKGPKIMFLVKDTGIGIPADKLTAIFEEYSQASDSISQRFGGTGLGLPIAKKLVEKYGGKLQVESVEGQGSRFTFDLQFTHPIQPDSVFLRRKARSDIKETYKILLADDNKANQLIASKWLKKMGHVVAIAENGEEVVEMNRKDQYDVILMDLQMPVLDGIEATRIIRNDPDPLKQNSCIIALSAGLKETSDLAETGMDGFISKPFEPKTLGLQIMKVLRSRKILTEMAPEFSGC